MECHVLFDRFMIFLQRHVSRPRIWSLFILLICPFSSCAVLSSAFARPLVKGLAFLPSRGKEQNAALCCRARKLSHWQWYAFSHVHQTYCLSTPVTQFSVAVVLLGISTVILM